MRKYLLISGFDEGLQLISPHVMTQLHNGIKTMQTITKEVVAK